MTGPGWAPLEVVAGPEELALRAAEVFLDVMRTDVKAKGCFSVALSGGQTPRAAYEEIARRSGQEQSLWEGVRVFWGDERCVPAADPESNERMARAALISQVPIPAGQVFPMRCAGDAAAAAERYEHLIREQLGKRPRYDLILLGLGEDGHTASLLPGSTALKETNRWVAVSHRPGERFDRLTLTSGVINLAARVLFLVSGAGKSEALRRARAGDPLMPASLVRPTGGELHWLVDAEAAGRRGKC